MKNNNKTNVSETSAKSSEKEIVFAGLYHSAFDSFYNLFKNELKKNKKIAFEELANPNQYIGKENPDKKPDIIFIMGHGSNHHSLKNEREVIHEIAVHDHSTLEELARETTDLVRDMAEKSKDDATIIIDSCCGGQSGIDILCNKSLKDGQSAIIFGGTNKLLISADMCDKGKQALSTIAEHEGKVSDELINELKDYYSSTFSIIHNSQLTKYSRLKCDEKNNFYREISIFDEKGGVWANKDREYIENPNLDLLLGFVGGTFAEIKHSKKGKKYPKSKINDKIDKSLKTLEIVIDRLQKDVFNTPNDGLVNELIIHQLIEFIFDTYKDNVTHEKFRYGLIDLLCKKYYKGLSEKFCQDKKKLIDKLIGEIESSTDSNLSPDLKTDIVNKLNNFFIENQTKFPSKTKESSLIEFRGLGRNSVYKSGLKFDYSKFSHVFGLVREGKYEEAIEYLIEIQKTSNIPDESKTQFHNILGCCFFNLKQYEKAETEFINALEHYEKAPQQKPVALNNIKKNLANTQFNLSRFDEAKRTGNDDNKNPSENQPTKSPFNAVVSKTGVDNAKENGIGN